MVDVSNHERVPEHNVLDAEEVEDVMEEYNIRKTDLPKIKYNRDKVDKILNSNRGDPMKKARKADNVDTALFAIEYENDTVISPGDVIEIVRNSRTTDRAVVYRLVVE